jgi:hypothetical protein
MQMQESTLQFKKELLSLNLKEEEVNWIEYAPQIIEEELPLPMFSDEEIQEKRKDEKILIAVLHFPFGNLQLYGNHLDSLVDNIYYVELNNESDNRFILKDLYEIKSKLDLAKQYAKENYDGFIHDFSYYEHCSRELLNGRTYERLNNHKFDKFTFWRHFAPIFGLNDTLQKDNYFIHNFHLKGQLYSTEIDNTIPVIYVTETFLEDIVRLIRNRLSSLNRLINMIEKRLGISFDQAEEKARATNPLHEQVYKEYVKLTPAPSAKVKKEFKIIKDANSKETRIIDAFNQEMNKPRMTQATALNNLSNRIDLGIGGKDPKNRKKQIHDTLKSFGIAIRKNKARE